MEIVGLSEDEIVVEVVDEVLAVVLAVVDEGLAVLAVHVALAIRRIWGFGSQLLVVGH